MVSFIIPSYNYEDLIPKAVKSIQDQTDPDWELIITDDMSSDGSLEVISPFLSDPRIKLVTNEGPKGIYPNILNGIHYAKGDYLKILMCDDTIDPLFLEKTLELFQKYPTIGLVSTRTQLINPEGKVLEIRGNELEKDYYPREEILEKTLIHINPIGNPSRIIFRKEAMQKAGGFDTSIEYCTEYDLWIRILINYDFGFVPEILTRELSHPKNATKDYVTSAGHILESEKMLSKNFKEHPFFKPRDRQIKVWLEGNLFHWKLAVKHYFQGNKKELKTMLDCAGRYVPKSKLNLFLFTRIVSFFFSRFQIRLKN